MITTNVRLAAAWLVAAAGVVALSALAWSGAVRPWDHQGLWQWTVWLCGAAAGAAVLASAGPRRLRVAAAATGAGALVAALGTWAREWWVLAHSFSAPGSALSGSGGGRVRTAAFSLVDGLRLPDDHLSVAGYSVGALLVVAAGAAIGTLARLFGRSAQSPAG